MVSIKDYPDLDTEDSEHIIDYNYPYLNEEQENMPTQKWLMEHCWEYGFILRYPADKEDITAFMAEPWHVRYVGDDVAKALHESGQVIEEYLDITSAYAQ